MSDEAKEALMLLVSDHGRARELAGLSAAGREWREHWLGRAEALLAQIRAAVEAA